MPAQPETGPGFCCPATLIGFAGLGQFAEIHVPENHPRDELEAEGHIRRLQPIGLAHVLGLEISHHLADVKLRLTIFRAVVDAHLRVVAVGDGLPEAQQVAAAGRCRPTSGHRSAGRWDGCRHGSRGFPCGGRSGTSASLPSWRQIHVDLVDLHPALVGVETVLRRKLRQRRLGRRSYFSAAAKCKRRLPGSSLPCFRHSTDFSSTPGLRERVIRNQAGVGQRVEQVTLVDLLDQFQRLLALALR